VCEELAISSGEMEQESNRVRRNKFDDFCLIIQKENKVAGNQNYSKKAKADEIWQLPAS
jgi:hypothetical protein